jgi:hypothetical protein
MLGLAVRHAPCGRPNSWVCSAWHRLPGLIDLKIQSVPSLALSLLHAGPPLTAPLSRAPPSQEVPWSRFLPPFLRELLARQVMWALRKGETSPSTAAWPRGEGSAVAAPFRFGVPSGEDRRRGSWHSHCRLRAQFESALTGLRTVTLTAWFGQRLARPANAATLTADLQCAKAAYDELSGAPGARQLSSFHAHARAVMAMGGWAQVNSYSSQNSPVWACIIGD